LRPLVRRYVAIRSFTLSKVYKFHFREESKRHLSSTIILPVVAIIYCLGNFFGVWTSKTEVPSIIASRIESILNPDTYMVLAIVLTVVLVLVMLIVRIYDLSRLERVRLRKTVSFIFQKLLLSMRILAGACFGFWIINNYSDIHVNIEFATLGWFAYFVIAATVISICSREFFNILIVKVT
jgi:hypothetical protein